MIRMPFGRDVRLTSRRFVAEDAIGERRGAISQFSRRPAEPCNSETAGCVRGRMRTLIAVFALGVQVPATFGQGYFRHNVSVGGGAARPGGELRSLFSDSCLGGVEYGFRFHPNFQLDAGFDSVFGAAGVRDWLPTAFGNLRIRDFQTFVPFGGRVILPIARDRFQIYGGMGGAYMRYGERIRQPFENSDYRIPCDVCARRDGFGYYGLFGGNMAVDQARRFRLGVGARVYRGHTSGDALGATPARETSDRWVNLFGSFSVSF